MATTDEPVWVSIFGTCSLVPDKCEGGYPDLWQLTDVKPRFWTRTVAEKEWGDDYVHEVWESVDHWFRTCWFVSDVGFCRVLQYDAESIPVDVFEGVFRRVLRIVSGRVTPELPPHTKAILTDRRFRNDFDATIDIHKILDELHTRAGDVQ